MSEILSSTIKEKSSDESLSKTWSFLIIKQGTYGSRVCPLETAVPFPSGAIKERT